jgi:hypothetical protein
MSQSLATPSVEETQAIRRREIADAIRAKIVAAWQPMPDTIQGPRWRLVSTDHTLPYLAVHPDLQAGPDGKTEGWHIWHHGDVFCDRNV